jgi:hypothetical protein
MIDIYAAAGTFADVHALARNAAAIVKTVEPRWTSENRQFVDRAKPAIFTGGRGQ